LVRSLDADLLARLSRQVASFDYPAALETLRILRERE
jgi:hypothetical protein